MRRKVILAAWIGLLLYVGIANAGTITFDFGGGKTVTRTTTSEIDVQLASLLVIANANAANAPIGVPSTPLTLEEYVAQIVDGALAGYQTQAKITDKNSACAAYQ